MIDAKSACMRTLQLRRARGSRRGGSDSTARSNRCHAAGDSDCRWPFVVYSVPAVEGASSGVNQSDERLSFALRTCDGSRSCTQPTTALQRRWVLRRDVLSKPQRAECSVLQFEDVPGWPFPHGVWIACLRCTACSDAIGCLRAAFRRAAQLRWRDCAQHSRRCALG